VGATARPCVIVATDLSESAGVAARFAASVAALRGADVVVAHVVEISLKSWLASRYDILADEAKRAQAEASVAAWYTQATGQAPTAVDLRVNTCFNGLTEAVHAHHAELLVMAPTGKSALTQIVVGSRVQDLASRPPCALVVAGQDTPPTHIAVATDFSEGAAQAVAFAGRLALHLHARVTLMHVAEVPDLPAFEEDLFAGSFEAFYQEADASLQAARAAHLPDGLAVSRAVLNGRAEVAIEAHVRQQGIELLVLGQTGHDSVLGDMLGSVPRALIGRMPCSVLVVPTGGTA